MQRALLRSMLGFVVLAGIASQGGLANAQTPPPPAVTKYFDLAYSAPQPDENICAGVAGGKMNDSQNFITWTCNANENNGYSGASDQGFVMYALDSLEAGGFFYYALHDVKDFNMCLGVQGGSTSDNATVMLWDCDGITHTDQYWLFFPDEQKAGCYFLYNFNSGMWLGVKHSGSVGTGDTLVQTEDANQTEVWPDGEAVPVPWCPHIVTP